MPRPCKPLPELSIEDTLRFWTKVRFSKDCWDWMDALSSSGRGNFWAQGHYWLASRVAWLISTGRDPGKSLVCHTCDNGACVNPAHLFLATHRVNMQDRCEKGRTRRGDNHPSSKLTKVKVQQIRKLYRDEHFNQYELATMFGVSQLHISRIIRKVAWSHV